MRDSPCHYCTKRPCFVHDTCPEYLDFRAKIARIKQEKAKSEHIINYTVKSIEKQKRRRK